MRIEERGCNMITDEQGREWLLQKLYDDGWRYIVADKYDNMYLTNEKPSMFDDVDEVRISSCKKYIGITGVTAALPKLSANEVFDLAEELGIVDWYKVEVDTPVFVRDSENDVWKCRYFAKYEYKKVYTWVDGRTSWSNKIADVPVCWKYAQLSEV